MIFDDVADAMNSDTARKISRRTGVDREKIRRMAKGLPFVLDYNTCFALERMGYEIKLEKRDKRH